MLEDFNLLDMDLVGYPFTRERGAGTTECIELRLDRGLVLIYFMNIFTDAKILNIKISTSDHYHILLKLNKANVIAQVRRFRFENAWLREPMCQQIVEEVRYSDLRRYFYDRLDQC